MRKSLIKVVQKCTGNQQVINRDGLLGHRGCTVGITKDAITRGMVLSFGVTSVDELERLTVGKRTTHHQITGDRVMLEALKHLTREELQIKSAGVTRAVRLTWASLTRSHVRRLKSHCINLKCI